MAKFRDQRTICGDGRYSEERNLPATACLLVPRRTFGKKRRHVLRIVGREQDNNVRPRLVDGAVYLER